MVLRQHLYDSLGLSTAAAPSSHIYIQRQGAEGHRAIFLLICAPPIRDDKVSFSDTSKPGLGYTPTSKSDQGPTFPEIRDSVTHKSTVPPSVEVPRGGKRLLEGQQTELAT